MQRFRKATAIGVPAIELFRWHLRPGALERLTPPWQAVEIVDQDVTVAPGTRVELRLGRGPVRVRWVAEHTRVEEGRGFEDVQLSGPFHRWRHRHDFEEMSVGESLLVDSIDFALPLSPLSEPLAGRLVRRSLQRTFAYRHHVTKEDLEFHRRYIDRGSRRVALVGANSLVGKALTTFLSTGGHEVIDLTALSGNLGRHDRSDETAHQSLEALDGLVYLTEDSTQVEMGPSTGESGALQNQIYARPKLLRTLAALDRPPGCVIVCWPLLPAGQMGHNSVMTHSRILADRPAPEGYFDPRAIASHECGRLRWVDARIGPVLSSGHVRDPSMPSRKLWRPAHSDLTGDRCLHWIGLDDVAAALTHLLLTESVEGVVDVVHPHPVPAIELHRIRREVWGQSRRLRWRAGTGRREGQSTAEAQPRQNRLVRATELERSGYRFREVDFASALRRSIGRE